MWIVVHRYGHELWNEVSFCGTGGQCSFVKMSIPRHAYINLRKYDIRNIYLPCFVRAESQTKIVVHMSRNDIIASYMHDYTSTTTTEPTSIDSLAGLDTQSRQNTPPP